MPVLPQSRKLNKVSGLRVGLGRLLYVATWPALYVYLRLDGQRTRVIVTSGDKILLVKDWLGDGSWKLPGGGLHRGEDPAIGAVRELKEETGLVAQPNQLTYIGQTVTHGHGFKVDIRCYELRLPVMTRPKPQNGEIIDAQWQPLDKNLAESHISSSTRQLIEWWRSQL